MTRHIRPHKGGRTVTAPSARMTPTERERLDKVLEQRGVKHTDWYIGHVEADYAEITGDDTMNHMQLVNKTIAEPQNYGTTEEKLALLVMQSSSALELRDAQDGDEGIKGNMLAFLDAMRANGYTFSVENNEVHVKKLNR